MDAMEIVIGILICIFIFIAGLGIGSYLSYETAYVDMKENRIEQKIRERYPTTWIKYNVKEEKK